MQCAAKRQITVFTVLEILITQLPQAILFSWNGDTCLVLSPRCNFFLLFFNLEIRNLPVEGCGPRSVENALRIDDLSVYSSWPITGCVSDAIVYTHTTQTAKREIDSGNENFAMLISRSKFNVFSGRNQGGSNFFNRFQNPNNAQISADPLKKSCTHNLSQLRAQLELGKVL